MAYLQAQGIIRATVFALALSLPLHMIFNYIHVYYADLGIAGISVGLTLNYCVTFVLLAF